MTTRTNKVVAKERDDTTISDNYAETLGYDPRPDVKFWHGTPIPPCQNPLPATPRLVEIAKKMWWNGDPWTILRNRNAFLAHAMDWTSHEDYLFLWNEISRDDWIDMLRQLRPGQVSTRSYRLCMRMAGLLPSGAPITEEWRANRHIKDLLFMNRRAPWEIRGISR